MAAIDAQPAQDLLPLLRLVLTPGLGPAGVAALLDRFGSADRVLGASAQEIAGVHRFGRAKADKVVRGMAANAADAGRELDRCAAAGIRLVARGSEEYPALLGSIGGPPPLLFVRGTLPTSPCCAMVGSRSCTAYGITQAERFGGVLAQAGICVVSGGAAGIDTASHRGALRAAQEGDVATVAVLGSGHAQPYPPRNAALFDEIAERGAVISELPLDTTPKRENFPARNRIVSGMSLGTLVIEAGRKSGALITARLAGDDHGREVMALPGRVDSAASAGCHDLLKAGGAMLVTEPSDVIELLESPARHAHGGTQQGLFADEQDTEPPSDDPIVNALRAGPAEGMGADELSEQTGIGAAELRSRLTLLEIRGLVKRSPAGLLRA